MTGGDVPAAELQRRAISVVLDATRSLLWLESEADARRIAVHLVQDLGGELVAAGTDDAGALPVDVSFGEGDPLSPAAPPGSEARALLERHLGPFLADARRILELRSRAERLAESAATDPLTGLLNRRMIDRALGRLRDGDVVIIIDLDEFKQVNDELGHAAGDDVLRGFGAVLRRAVRSRDVVGRFGGEEFVVVVEGSADVEALLDRLRAEWLLHRPLPVTFSAGIARSVGDPDETMLLADQALYRAKDAGRDRWQWADARPATDQAPSDYVQPYLDDALLGRREPAVRLALDLLDNRVSREEIITDLLAPAQLEVGERWYRNELTPADEHVATGVTAAALDALAADVQPAGQSGLTVVACAEGDWHALAAQMLGESLRSLGVGVTVLGASAPAEAVGSYLVRSGADSLAVSCNLPIFLPGAVRLIDAAHEHGIPVIVGGRAFGHDDRRAAHLGADGWASTAAAAADILTRWRVDPPSIQSGATTLDGAALRLFADAASFGEAAVADLAERFPPMAAYDARQRAQTVQDLVFIVEFLAAALLVAEDEVFLEFLDWLRPLLASRGVPPQALTAGLDALLPLVADLGQEAGRVLQVGRRHRLEQPD